MIWIQSRCSFQSTKPFCSENFWENSIPNPDFRSFSDAHCQVSNELYQFLQRPKFLFCPVEYCASRSVPNVKESEYLQTIGKQLEKNIHVFWTGSMVVSEVITVKECQVDSYEIFWKERGFMALCIIVVEGDFVATFIVNGQFNGPSLYSLN